MDVKDDAELCRKAREKAAALVTKRKAEAERAAGKTSAANKATAEAEKAQISTGKAASGCFTIVIIGVLIGLFVGCSASCGRGRSTASASDGGNAIMITALVIGVIYFLYGINSQSKPAMQRSAAHDAASDSHLAASKLQEAENLQTLIKDATQELMSASTTDPLYSEYRRRVSGLLSDVEMLDS